MRGRAATGGAVQLGGLVSENDAGRFTRRCPGWYAAGSPRTLRESTMQGAVKVAMDKQSFGAACAIGGLAVDGYHPGNSS